MKCEKCGARVHQGDQICINCGNKLVIQSSIMHDASELPEIKLNYKATKKSNKKIIIGIICAIVLILLGIILLILLRG
jgi:uncharacterized membrane protein YvbJ